MFEVGDVIMSSIFPYGFKRKTRNGKTFREEILIHHGVYSYYCEFSEKTRQDPQIKEAFKNLIGPQPMIDESRSGAKFVIEEVDLESSGGGHNDAREYERVIRARRLNQNGDFDPNGELICFYISDGANNGISESEIRVIGHKQKVVSFV